MAGRCPPAPFRRLVPEISRSFLILVGYLLPVPAVIATIDWVVLAIGVVLLILVQVGRPVGGRRYWY